MLALGIPFYAFAVGLLLFGVIVVARFALSLAREVRTLADASRLSAELLGAAAEDLSAEAGRAVRSVERIQAAREGAPRRPV